MADREFDLSDSALVGHVVSVDLLSKLVEKEIISPDEACELLESSLLKLEEWQAKFPEDQIYFESARGFLSRLVAAIRAKMKKRPE